MGCAGLVDLGVTRRWNPHGQPLLSVLFFFGGGGELFQYFWQSRFRIPLFVGGAMFLGECPASHCCSIYKGMSGQTGSSSQRATGDSSDSGECVWRDPTRAFGNFASSFVGCGFALWFTVVCQESRKEIAMFYPESAQTVGGNFHARR